jgi:hypothetical protein
VEPKVSACVDVPGGVHDGELIFLAEGSSAAAVGRFRAIDLTAGDRSAVRPLIPDDIARQLASGWRNTPTWLGSLGKPAADELADARTR